MFHFLIILLSYMFWITIIELAILVLLQTCEKNNVTYNQIVLNYFLNNYQTLSYCFIFLLLLYTSELGTKFHDLLFEHSTQNRATFMKMLERLGVDKAVKSGEMDLDEVVAIYGDWILDIYLPANLPKQPYCTYEIIEWTNFFFYINYENFLNVTPFTVYIQIILLLTIIVIHIISLSYLKYQNHAHYEYGILLQYGLLFLIFLSQSIHLIGFITSLVGVSTIIYTMLGIEVKENGSEAALKYYFLSALTTGLITYGTFIILSLYQTLEYNTINWMSWNLLSIYLPLETQNIEQFFLLNAGGIILIIIGILFKLGAFPAHLWTIEIYEGSPNPVMAFFLMPMKLVVFTSFARLLTYALNALHSVWEIIIWISSIMSLLWGCFGAVTEQSLKKFIGYSSINQMGYLLIGITILYIDGFNASMLYLTIYMITNIIMLGILFSIRKSLSNERIITIFELNNFVVNNFGLLVILTIIFFSMAGIPPLAGFFGKFYLFFTALNREYFSLVFTGMLTSVISTFYYLNFFSRILFINSIDSKYLIWENNVLLAQLIKQLVIILLLFSFLNSIYETFIYI